MSKLRTWIAIGGVLLSAGLPLLFNPRMGAFAIIALALAVLAVVAYRTL